MPIIFGIEIELRDFSNSENDFRNLLSVISRFADFGIIAEVVLIDAAIFSRISHWAISAIFELSLNALCAVTNFRLAEIPVFAPTKEI